LDLRRIIEEGITEMKEYYAAETLARVRRANEKVFGSAQVRREPGLGR
jgi:predicted DNA-binding protein